MMRAWEVSTRLNYDADWEQQVFATEQEAKDHAWSMVMVNGTALISVRIPLGELAEQALARRP